MKKITLLALLLLGTFTLSGCGTDTDNNLEGDPDPTGDNTVEELGSEDSLATLSYLSAGFLGFSNVDVNTSNVMFLSNTEEDDTVIEGELDEVNIYVDRLKVLMDDGLDTFGSVTEEESDNELYEYKLTFTVNEEVYVIYYNVDAETGEMTGVIMIGEVEFEFEVVDNIQSYEHTEHGKGKPENAGNGNGNANQNPDDEEDEEVDAEDETDTEETDTEEETDGEEPEETEVEEDEDENETKMVLIASNGTDTIKVIYKAETEEDEVTTKFYMEKTIDGVTEEVQLKISEEEGEQKVTITEGEDTYSFKREVEDEGTVYRLDYHVDGVRGFVKITEIVGEDGEITYEYKIQEAGRQVNRTKQEPRSGFDEEDEEDTNEETETEGQDA